MIKKSIIMMTVALLGSVLTANAQLFPYTGTSTAPSSTIINATSTASSSATTTTNATSTTITTTVLPVAVSAAGMTSGYLQIDGLTVVSVPAMGTGWPAQILAANPTYTTMTAAGTVMAPTTAVVTCTQFASDSSMIGIAIGCPTPAVTTMQATTTSSASNNSSYYSPYTITVNAATQLLLSDRSPATIANIQPGDMINVYGYYAGNGIFDAEILRDLSQSPDGVTVTSNAPSVAMLQSELAQLQTLVAQLESDIALANASTTTATSTTITTTIVSPSLGTSLYCPMIAASGATSSVPCPPTSSTTGTYY